MTTHEFHTPNPTRLYVEAGSGTLTLTAHETETTHVEVLGEGADEVEVRQEGDHISVVAPQRTRSCTSPSRCPPAARS
jgi:hypothetical protein